MPSPLPGVDPYLEQPTFWPSFHNRLIVAIANSLASDLRPHYYIEIETRTYTDTLDGELLVGVPDGVVLSHPNADISDAETVEVHSSLAVQSRPQQVMLPIPTEIKERYLEVREVGTDAVITVIEVLSPKNKRPGPGRAAYETKRQAVLASASHLVEIDLLRAGKPLPMSTVTPRPPYYILVSRSRQRPQADFYGFSIREPLPIFPLPLRGEKETVSVNLPEIFTGVYDLASYDLRIDYQQPPPPPAFSQDDIAWINAQHQNSALQ